jgi:hypothetical protein
MEIVNQKSCFGNFSIQARVYLGFSLTSSVMIDLSIYKNRVSNSGISDQDTNLAITKAKVGLIGSQYL